MSNLWEAVKKISVQQFAKGAFVGCCAIVFIAGLQMREPIASAAIVLVWALSHPKS